MSENENSNQQAVNSLLAQLDAYRLTLNESLQTILILRTNLILLEKNNTNIKNQLDNANKRILELEVPPKRSKDNASS